MTKRGRYSLCLLSTLWTASIAAAPAAEIDFSHDIVPILREHCGNCHTGGEKQGGFSMNTRESLLAGGDLGGDVIPGKSGESELIARISSDDADLRMPPEGEPLPAAKIALLRQWIDAGAPWEPGFAFQQSAYEPPLRPRRVELPPAVAGRENPVDRIVDAYLAEHGIEPLGAVDDATFLRRVSLDVVGLLPTPEQLADFLADGASDKRQRLVDDLLADDVAYAEHWLTFWNDLLRNDYTGTGFITGGRKQITDWLHRSLIDNKPYDQFVRELIAPTSESEGFIQGIRWRGDVSASQTQEIQFAQNISQAFLGINMKCASCHNSFIDRWTLDETYGLAAIYATAPLEIHRCDKPIGQQAKAAWIFPELGQIRADAPQPERLQQLAALMTHPENGRFTRTIVNRIWHRLMGRGIVHPVDAMHTPPWSADLLDYLAVHLADHGCDLKQTIRLICTSQAYQAATPPLEDPAEGGSYVFRGPLARRMTAEQFMDVVWQITGAGPSKADVNVLRARLAPSDAEKQVEPAAPRSPSDLAGRWIWSYAEASGGVPAAGETITVRRQFELNALPTRAAAVVTCDNEYTVYVNRARIQADTNWETVESVPLAGQLRAGANEILIVARNAGSGPNPAGLYFEARIRLPDDTTLVIGSDASWQWTASVPDAQGRFADGQPAEWKPAAVLANPAVWASRVDDQLVALLARPSTGSQPMVRASLMKNDAFMRALGRPTRDQIVSMRPSDLTTLEAINLSNGQDLADTIARGAPRALQQVTPTGDWATELASWLFAFSLSRGPTSHELIIARQLLGDSPAAENVEDLMWAVFMLPEFQLVR